ncbi:MAG: hypothetical protein A3H25_14015 [Sphingomonadales bacterium RIFCSPLOWO2_12_FULL_63_15]|nr:MAG: hypothetical protein A3H25_14015 [Sphingomonadales bacterium RIFCSPLOWO2_12_FULL_63_15]
MASIDLLKAINKVTTALSSPPAAVLPGRSKTRPLRSSTGHWPDHRHLINDHNDMKRAPIGALFISSGPHHSGLLLLRPDGLESDRR